MSEAATLEQRVAALESEVVRLKDQLNRAQGSQGWFAAVGGCLKDEPDFEQVLRLGREIRRSDRPYTPG